MRRLLADLRCSWLALPAAAGRSALGADGDGGGYKVRAIFDNVAAAVPGEDVKVAGAKVGVIESMDVTDGQEGGGHRCGSTTSASRPSAPTPRARCARSR